MFVIIRVHKRSYVPGLKYVLITGHEQPTITHLAQFARGLEYSCPCHVSTTKLYQRSIF